jgi:hypothetical protein
MPRDATLYVAVGEPKPLFPRKPDLIDRWQAAARSRGARERLRARLPAGVTLTDDDCLSMVKRPAYTDRIEGLARDGRHAARRLLERRRPGRR